MNLLKRTGEDVVIQTEEGEANSRKCRNGGLESGHTSRGVRKEKAYKGGKEKSAEGLHGILRFFYSQVVFRKRP